MKYWPGTNIVKSEYNVFNWKGKTSFVLTDNSFKKSNEVRLQMAGASSKGQVKSLSLSKGKK